MKFNKTEKLDFAITLKARVNEAYDQETRSTKGVLPYIGVCRITTMIEQEFLSKVDELPKLIEGACLLARAYRNPNEIASKSDLRRGLALLATAAGGLSIIWGILSSLNILTALGVVLATHIPVIGPAIAAAGFLFLVGGIYMAITKQSPEALSAKAHSLLIEAISNWADEKAAKEKDAVAEIGFRRQLSAPGNNPPNDEISGGR